MKHSSRSALSHRRRLTRFWLLALATLIGVSAAAINPINADVSSIDPEQRDASGPDDGTTSIFLPVISNQGSVPTPTSTPIPSTINTPTPTSTPTSTSIPMPSTTSTPSTPTIRFAVIGDFGEDSTAEDTVAAMIAAQNPDFIITGGDNRYGSASYDRVVGHYFCDYLAAVEAGPNCAGGNRATNAFFPVLGNHDYNDGGGIDEYLGYFTLPGSGIATSGTSGSERYYDVLWGPVHFFFLDSDAAIDDSTDRAAQQNWLSTQMIASTAPWQIVVFHHASYSSALHGSETAMQWPYRDWGADAVITGHDHTYERISRDGLVYFVNGLGGRSIYEFNTPITGSQVRYNSDYGAMLVDANATGILFRFLTHAGAEIDRYTVGTAPSATSIHRSPGAGTVARAMMQRNDELEETVAVVSIE